MLCSVCSMQCTLLALNLANDAANSEENRRAHIIELFAISIHDKWSKYYHHDASFGRKFPISYPTNMSEFTYNNYRPCVDRNDPTIAMTHQLIEFYAKHWLIIHLFSCACTTFFELPGSSSTSPWALYVDWVQKRIGNKLATLTLRGM